KQRVALARVLAAAPRVLLLDDALSSVDAETERTILDQLRGFFRERTTILVAHRLTTVKEADLICVLDEGRVVELGDHESLLARGGIVGQLLAAYWQQYLTMVVAQRSLADLRVALFARVQRFPMRFFDRNPVGRIVSRLTTDVDVLQEMFAAGAMTIVLDFLGLLGILGFMLWINWALALVSMALLPFMVFAIDYFRRMARKTYRLIRERIGRINGYLQEAISGMAAIALAGREARAFAEFERLNADHRDANHLSNKLEAALFSFVEAVSTVSIALMLWEGGRLHGV